MADHGGGPAGQGIELLEPLIDSSILLSVAIMVLVVSSTMDMTPTSAERKPCIYCFPFRSKPKWFIRQVAVYWFIPCGR